MTPTRRWVITEKHRQNILAPKEWETKIEVVPAADYDAMAEQLKEAQADATHALMCLDGMHHDARCSEQLPCVRCQRDALAKRVEELEGERDELARLYDTMTKSHDAVTEQLRGQRDRYRKALEEIRDAAHDDITQTWIYHIARRALEAGEGTPAEQGE